MQSHLTLDFDLKASNSVSFDDAGVPTQMVEPFLLADGAGLFHHVARARVAIDLTAAAATPRIVPRESGAGMYWIVQLGTGQLHTDFASFATDLDARLSAGALVKHIVASGPYDDASATITAGFATVLLE